MTVLDKTAPGRPRAGHASVVNQRADHSQAIPERTTSATLKRERVPAGHDHFSSAHGSHLSPVPSPAEQAAFEDRLVDLLVRINEGWLHRQEAGR
jgi:hypothetical protein